MAHAYCPELPGCQSQGDTFEEINANIKEAVELYLETVSPEHYHYEEPFAPAVPAEDWEVLKSY